MIIAALAVVTCIAGISLARWGQRVEANAVDQDSMDDWSKFVKAMGGKRQ